MIGMHVTADQGRYSSDLQKVHCVGANFALAEGHSCTSADVIQCPMFPFHLEKSLEVTPENRAVIKENIVLIDNDADAIFDLQRLQRDLRALGLRDVQVLVHEGRERREVPELYRRTKVTLDCRNGGVEFINYEAALYDVLTLSCSSRATRNALDFPVPSRYLVEPQRWTQTVRLVHSLLVNYTDHLPHFAAFKQLSRTSTERMRRQLDMHLFARDVIFRTWCRSYSECRRTVPWAVAVWTLHPLARIDVYCSVPVDEFVMDNDAALQLLKRQYAAQYFRLTAYDAAASQGAHPAGFFAQSPCSHVVYAHPSLLLFGRDMLNTHMWALAQALERVSSADAGDGQDRQGEGEGEGEGEGNIDGRSEGWIVHTTEDGEVVLSVTTERPLARLVKVQGDAAVYLELVNMIRQQHRSGNTSGRSRKGLLRRVETYAVYALLRAHGVRELRQVAASYVQARGEGAVLTMAEAQKLLAPAVLVQSQVPVQALVVDGLLIPDPSISNGQQGESVDSDLRSDGYEAGACDGAGSAPKLGGTRETVEDLHSAHRKYPDLRAPHFWLTSQAPLLPVTAALHCLSAAQLERVVEHLDPVLQGSLMQRVLGLLPADIREVLAHFDAVRFPHVISLLDGKHQNWG